MIRTHFEAQYEYFLNYFQGTPVKTPRDGETGKILFDAGIIAAYLGYESTEYMISRGRALYIVNQHSNHAEDRYDTKRLRHLELFVMRKTAHDHQEQSI